MSLHPQVKWSERQDKVFITVQLPDAKNAKVNLEPEGVFTFSANAGSDDKLYELKLDLLDKVNVEESKISIGTRSIVCVLEKAEPNWWKKLLRGDDKTPHYVKVDCDEDQYPPPILVITTTDTVFGRLPDDVVLNIFFKLEEDPRNWARMACVCTKFLSLVTDVCWRNKCIQTMSAVVADLIPTAGADPPGGWAALHKLAVCCPGLLHSGVLLENSDFGLERELGPEESFQVKSFPQVDKSQSQSAPSSSKNEATSEPAVVSGTECSWSLYDDLYYDTVYVAPELQEQELEKEQKQPEVAEKSDKDVTKPAKASKRRKICRSLRSHLASGVWNLSREQGNKLLASRFRGDCLYICDWPGCIHMEEKRNYMLFRGVFKDFKKSRVWRTINDGNRSKIELNCAFCACKQTWDLHSAFCLRRVYGFHDDGEPVVRAYVCENGHVSGAWTDWPLYT